MTTKPRRRQGGGRPAIDWPAAKTRFVRDITLGYEDIAKIYGVSSAAVRQHARAEDWEAARRTAIAEAERIARAGDVPALVDRQRRTIEVAEKLRDRILNADTDLLDLETAVRTLPQYAKLEQLFAGEATDRIAVAEVQALFSAFVKVTARYVPAASQAQFLAELDAEAGGLLGGGS